uniref:Reverse transcriptase domain-containing protein n=1 Tax=Tanacetum cinerariifolium TaxID=118510 RepID=A0A699GU30_TANCI|nr:reverse transcriptase domain-containing protein [Tanacetum cinerariifolium]
MSGSPEPRRDHSESPRKIGPERRTVFKRLEKGVFHRLGDKGKEERSLLPKNVITKEHPHEGRKRCWKVKVAQEDIGSRSQRGKSQVLRTTCPNHGIPRELPLAEKCIKDTVEIHNIKQRDGESIEEFVRRYKLECRDVKGALKCLKISGFMHEITNPELIKRLHDKIPKSVDKMMKVTTAFLRGEVAASNRERKKSILSRKQQEAGQKQNFKKGGFRNQQRPERKQDRFTLLTKTPKDPGFRQRKRIKAKQWKRLGEGGKKGENLKKGQADGDTDGEEDGMEGPMIIETEMGGHCVHCMEARGKEDPGSSIYGLQNSKIPSDMRNGHATDQQDYSTRMHNGFRARGATARNQPSHRRKNSGGNSPRISEANYSNRLYVDGRRDEGAMQFTKAQP